MSRLFSGPAPFDCHRHARDRRQCRARHRDDHADVFAVTKVILEFGRWPTASNAVNVIYTSEPGSYNLSHTFDPPTFPTTDRFDATFRFPR